MSPIELLGGNCRYCGEPVTDVANAAITHSYWQGIPFICHSACKDKGVKLEAYDCQVIDADCNDCKCFVRSHMVGKDVWAGHCQKFDRETRAYPKKWTGRECFEHRRSPSL